MPLKATVKIGIANYPHAQQAALGGLIDLLTTANTLAQPPPEAPLEAIRIEPGDTRYELSALILPPTLGQPPEPDQQVSEWLTTYHDRNTILCSVCAGAFLLADTGMLNGKPATTHWALAAEFRQRFPEVELDTDQLIIEADTTITAGGLMAWIDLGLRLIETFLGRSAMIATSRYFLVDAAGREQRHYSRFLPSTAHQDQPVLRVQNWLEQNFQRTPINLDDMAAVASLSVRTFLRRFQQATRHQPTDYLRQLRVSKARVLIEETSLSFERIADQVGFNDSSTFRRSFQRVTGLTPRAYRQRFVRL